MIFYKSIKLWERMITYLYSVILAKPCSQEYRWMVLASNVYIAPVSNKFLHNCTIMAFNGSIERCHPNIIRNLHTSTKFKK